MQVVVTGGAGKLGRWVVAELLTHGHRVVVFDRVRAPENPAARYVVGDILDLGQVFGALADGDAVIHLAGIYSHGITTDDVTFRANVMGAFNVHEAAWRLGIKRIVTMSSEAVLGWAPGSYAIEHVPEYLPIDEDHPCRPQDCYGLSKQAAEAVAQSYSARSDMETVILRAPWIVSPEEIEGLKKSNGRQPVRFALYHYVEVRDLAEACRLAVERPLSGSHVLFVGSGDSLVAEPLSTLYPRLMPAIGDKASGLTGQKASVDTSRGRRTLGWAPRHFWRSQPTGGS